MNSYSNILVAVDFSPSAELVLEKALLISQQQKAKFTILHVVDHLPPLGFGEEPLIAPDWMIPEKELLDESKKSLLKLVSKYDLLNANQLITLGTAHNEIVRVAEEQQHDLIVMGSHGRRGVRLLLGSTANGVLHHASCDVLAIRIEG